MNSLGEKLLQLRGSESQAHAAERCGISQQLWSALERNLIKPGETRSLKKIADAYDIDINALDDAASPDRVGLSPADSRAQRERKNPASLRPSLRRLERDLRDNPEIKALIDLLLDRPTPTIPLHLPPGLQATLLGLRQTLQAVVQRGGDRRGAASPVKSSRRKSPTAL